MAATTTRRHSVPRRASQNKALSTLRTRLTVRLLEYLYPFRGLNFEPYTREITGKWIYAFHAPSTLIAEIYAAENGWLKFIRPGKGDDVAEVANTIHHHEGPGFFTIPNETEQYYFFLSPIQLGPEGVAAIQKAYKNGDSKAPAHQEHLLMGETLPVRVDGEDYWYFPQSGLLDVSRSVTCHSYKKRDPEKLYAVLIPDPYAWAEDIQFMGHLPALGLVDAYQKKNSAEVEVALGFHWALESDPDDKLDIRNDLANKQKWFDFPPERPRSIPPEFALQGNHPYDSRRTLTRLSKVDPSDWRALPNSATDVADLRLKMHNLVCRVLLNLTAGFATELAEWAEGPRHRIVEQASLEMGGDSLTVSILHFGFIGYRLDATDPGKKWLLASYEKEKSAFVPAFFHAIEKPETVEEKWYKPIKKYANAAMWVVKHFIGAIHAVDEKGFEDVIKHSLCKQVFGLEWKKVDLDKVPKLWGKPVLKAIPSGLLVPENSAAILAKEKFEKYKLAEWFEGIGLAFEAIDVCLTLNKVMSEETSLDEKFKAALETTGFAIELVKFGVGLEETAEAKLAVKRLRVAGGVVKVVTGFVEFDVAVKAGLKAYYSDGNYAVAALQGLAAVTTAVGIVGGSFEFAAAVLGAEAATPLAGWVAFVLTAAGIGLAWLISKFERNKWEEVANFSYLGRYCTEDRGHKFYKDYFGGWSTGFWKDCNQQRRALTALTSSFQIKGEPGRAISGEIKLYPTFVRPDTRFRIVWQFRFLRIRLEGRFDEWVKVESDFKVGEFRPAAKCTPESYKANIAHSITLRADGNVDYVTLKPNFTVGNSLAEEVLFLVQCMPNGEGGPNVPLDVEYKVAEGPAAGTYESYLHTSVVRAFGDCEAAVE